MILEGTAHRFGANINTDYIISAHAKEQAKTITDMVPFLMQDIAPGFSDRIAPGDFIVAASNFGCGSSREAAPAVIKAAGLAGVIAPSFARIFYRNAVNVGLPLLVCETDEIQDRDVLHVDFAAGKVWIQQRNVEIVGEALPGFLREILDAGGLLPYFKTHTGFEIGGGAG